MDISWCIDIINEIGCPLQLPSGPVNTGVTMINAVPGWVAMNEILPVPLAAKPIDVLLFVH